MSEQSKPQSPAAASLDATADDRFSRAKAGRAAAIAKRDSERQTSGAVREREPDLGGPRLKLSVVGEIPGHTMCWEHDEDGKIEERLYEGFDFVAPGEVRRTSDLVADMDLTNRVSRYVGRREDGSPLRAYLLKCPTDIWTERKSREQRQVDDWDSQIRNGRMKPKDNTEYVPQGYQSKLETNARIS